MKNTVYLVGAGPGDKELITVRGLSLLKIADVIVYDHLINTQLLEIKKDTCETIYVGKEAAKHTLKQEEINELLISLAHEKECVVRLKGGDPYVFGRGGEEGEALFNADIPFEVVPGITSSIGGLTYAGIPITSRGIATSFHVVTGHTSSESSSLDYDNLANVQGTLVFLMGVANLKGITEGLINAGKETTTPVAIVCQATTPKQKVYIGKLNTILDVIAHENIQPPALIVVGDVVNQREQLNFYERRPLFGKKILVTRSRSTHSKFTELLEALGGEVIQMPTIQTVPIQKEQLIQAVQNIYKYNKIIFTSGVAVELFFGVMKELKRDARVLSGQKIIAIGSETRKILENQGVYADFEPVEYSKEGISQLLTAHGTVGEHLLIPRSAKGDHAWIETLKKSYQVTEIQCYDTLFVEEATIEEKELDSFDYITFTSASTVHGFMNLMDKDKLLTLKNTNVVAIGPTTRAAIEDYGIKVHLQPEKYTIGDMVTCIVDHVTLKQEAN